MTSKIFICYRRDDDAGFTQMLYDELRKSFAQDDVFMDERGHIEPGDAFPDVIRDAIVACEVLLVVMGARWSELLQDRASHEEDYVLREIRLGLELGKRVIPVLVGGAHFPSTSQLPEEIRDLARRNAVVLSRRRFKDDCADLVGHLRVQVVRDGSGGNGPSRRWVVWFAAAVVLLIAVNAALIVSLDCEPPIGSLACKIFFIDSGLPRILGETL